MKKIAVLALSLILSACGGGGSSGGTSSPTLSADQSTFEGLILAPNASYSPNWLLPSSGPTVTGTHFFYATPISLAASPLTSGVQSPSSGATVNLSTGLTILPGTVTRYLVNGAILTDSSTTDRYTYSGTGIKRETIAADGVTLLTAEMRSGLQSVSLSGLVTAAPADFNHNFNALYFNPTLLSGTATWGAGARYVAYTATNTLDRYRVFDATSTVTTGTSPTPVASGTTIATLMAAGGISSSSDSTTYTMANGTVAMVNGVNTYVANALRPNSTTDRYRTYYELNGNVYTGDVARANTVIGGSSYSVTSGGVTTVNYTNKVQVRLNKAAIDSLKAAVTF